MHESTTTTKLSTHESPEPIVYTVTVTCGGVSQARSEFAGSRRSQSLIATRVHRLPRRCREKVPHTELIHSATARQPATAGVQEERERLEEAVELVVEEVGVVVDAQADELRACVEGVPWRGPTEGG